MTAKPEAAVRLFLCAVALATGLAACAPRLAPPGPLIEAPAEARLTGGSLVTRDGLTLRLRSWSPAGPPAAVILALHGYNDYSKAFEDPATFLAGEGFLVYAYDQRGFGESPHTGIWAGSRRLTGDLSDAAHVLRTRHPNLPFFLLGVSMGGAVILAAAGGGELPPTDGVVLAAPAVWARSTMPWYQRVALWTAAHSLPWARLTGKGLNIRPSDNIEMLRELGRDPLVIKGSRIDAIYGLVNLMDEALAAAPHLKTRALLLYGERDEIVPKDPSFRLWRDLPDSVRRNQRRALYENGWHMLLRDLEAERVLGDIAAWIEDQDAPLPSGADAHALAALQREGDPTPCREQKGSPKPVPEATLAEAPLSQGQTISAASSADPGPSSGC